jgi:ATP-dependent DNA helicase UvrD/PcrA
MASLAKGAASKGITLLGTGDFTHPAWFAHLRETLLSAEPGLYRLGDDAAGDRQRGDARSEHPVRFMLSVEISTIYKRGDRTRKVHHLIYMPDLDAAERFNARLGRIGNLGSDGRPILGLDSRDLLEIVLEASPDGFVVPAHIWTPWFSAMGSKSGFDRIADCYADLADHIFAIETGLSSDPAMNWRVSSLDRYRLVSNSDAHSLPALGREATILSSPLDYFSVRDALRTGVGLDGTLEFFPEEGKYHADGHRACGINWTPEESTSHGGLCTECRKPITVGVQARVDELADRPDGSTPPGTPPSVEHIVQLAQIIGEINGVGPKSKSVQAKLAHVVAAVGPELHVLRRAPLDDITRAGGELLGEAIRRLRAGDVRRTAGFDGEYGIIRLFAPGEIGNVNEGLFDLPVPAAMKPRPPKQRAAPRAKEPEPPMAPPPSPHEPFEPMLAGMEDVGTGLLDRLDALQRVAASAPGGPMLIVAGPGTGKTRTLTHRIAYLCADMDVFPEECLAITFTRRAAGEVAERLATLLGPVAEDVTVSTFHALCRSILRDHASLVDLAPDFPIAADDGDEGVPLDQLVPLVVEMFDRHPDLVDKYRGRWPWVFVDEYQDIDPAQYALLRHLVPADGNLCAIGDPDQAIYSFRGADVAFFLRFTEDYPDARTVRLTRNYRSSAPILATAVQAIAPSTLVRGRRLDPARLDPEAPQVGLYPAGSAADEADFVVRTIDELVGGLSHGSLDSGRVDSRLTPSGTVSFADIAVLYRTDAQAAPIVDALTRGNVPTQKRSHDRLKDRPGVAAIARELRFGGGGGSVVDAVRVAGQRIAERLRVPTLDPPPHEARLSEADLHLAVEVLRPLAGRSGQDMETFLADIATGLDVDALDPRAQAVTLLTLHASKGLEFPVVFLVGCEDGLLPLRFPGRTTTPEDVAEERRLFFVGLTRAQDRLFVSHAKRRSWRGTDRDMSPSRFFDPIDPRLFEHRGQQATRRPKDHQLRLL